MIFSFFLAFSVLISSPAVFARPALERALDHETALRGLSEVIDGGEWCSLGTGEAKTLLLPLRPLWEESLKEVARKSTMRALIKRSKKCETECTCGFLATVLEKKKNRNRTLIDALEKREKSTSKELKLACLRKRKDLCKTLLPRLRKVAEKEYRSEGNF
jgi:hypothetical protein